MTVLAALMAATLATTPVTTSAPAELRQALDRVVAAGAVSAIAEVRAGHTTVRAGSGTAEWGGRRPVPVDGRYRVGSVTKTFVATVVLQLVGQGRLRLADPVERWVPGLVPAGITVERLLRHQSGLYDYADALLPRGDTEAFLRVRLRTFTARELVRIATAHPPVPPAYSNTDFVVLGLVVEAVTGRGYGTEIRQRILRPLRLDDTDVPGTRPYLTGPHAHVYVARDGVPVDVTVMSPTLAGAAGEMISTTADLNRFLRALVGGRLLRPAELAAMTSGTGMGLEVFDVPGCGRIVGHGGGGPGFHGGAFSRADGSRQVSVTGAVWTGRPGDTVDEARAAAQVAAVGEILTVGLCPGR
jgi:D-alanyl-D-alanine carboxypeptidase